MEAYQPCSAQAAASCGPPEKQWKTVRAGAPSASRTSTQAACASRSWICRGRSRSLARAMCARKASRWATAPFSPVRKKSRPLSPTATTTSAFALSVSSRRTMTSSSGSAWCSWARGSSPSGPVSRTPAWRTASLGCTARATRTPGSRRARARLSCQVVTSQAEVTTRVTPTAAARSTSSAALSGASEPGPPASAATGRCVWLSVTGAARGATASAGGQERSRFLDPMRPQELVTSSGTEPA